MKREDLLKEMKDMIGKKDPIVFFESMVTVFGLLFDRIDQLENNLKLVKNQSALAIQWEPKVAASMLAEKIQLLKADSDTYFTELVELKKAYTEDRITQNYNEFCEFWQNTLGYHPFLDYE